MPFGIPDTRQFPWDQSLSNNLQQLSNKTTGGINTWAVNPTVGVDGLALGPAHEGYTGVNTSTSNLVRWNGTAWVTIMDSPKLVTTPKLTLYVSQSTGNDANNGMTAGTAWKTTSKLYQELLQYNYLEKQIDIYLGAGKYALSFPNNVGISPIRLYGASSSSVIVQSLYINGQNVTIQGMTISNTDLLSATYSWWPVVVANAGILHVGPDVTFGSLGTFTPSKGRRHLTCRGNSSIRFYANSPVTITGSVNGFCSASDSSMVYFSSYTPEVNVANMGTEYASNGVVYDSVSKSLTTSNTMCLINCVGNLSIERFFDLYSASVLRMGRVEVTGTVTGVAYYLYDNSYIETNVVRGTPAAGGGIGFPMSISSGSKDATSTVYGTTF